MNSAIPTIICQQNPYHEKFNRFFLPYRRTYDASFYDDGQGEIEEVRNPDWLLVDEQAQETFLRRIAQDHPQIVRWGLKTVAESMGFVRNGYPTKLALLLFGKAPEAHFPEFSIRITFYETDERKVIGEGISILDSFRIEGTIPEMADTALLYLREDLKSPTDLSSSKIRYESRPDIPESVLREVILNALVHRDYSRPAESLPIEIEIFPSRIEVVSPGSLYESTDAWSPGSDPLPLRNPHLAMALTCMHRIDNRGFGLPMVRHEMKRVGLPEPRFISEGDRFIVILDRKIKSGQCF